MFSIWAWFEVLLRGLFVFCFFLLLFGIFFKETRHLSVCPPVLLKKQLLVRHLVSPVPKENSWSGNPSPDDLLNELCSRSGQSGKKSNLYELSFSLQTQRPIFLQSQESSSLLKGYPWKVSL